MADLAPARGARTAGLTNRIVREVVVQQERFLVSALQRVDPLLILAGAERRHHQCLRLAAREQSRAVGSRQDADLGHDRAHGLDVTAVDAVAGVEDIPAHDLGFEFLEHAGDLELGIFRAFHALGQEMRHHFCLGRFDGVVTRHLVGNGISGAQLLLDQAEHLFFERGIVGDREFARLFGGLFRELDDRLDDRLEMPMAEHHRAEHGLFGQLLRLRFNHEDGVLRAGDDEVELAFRHLVQRRIEHVFIVDEADAGAADRPHERRTG